MFRRSLAILLIVMTALFFTGVSVLAEAPADGPQTWSVAVGNGNDAAGASIDMFFPGTTYVHEGDTVAFSNGGNYPHTVTFLGDKTIGEVMSDPNFNLAAPTAPSGEVYNGQFLSSGFLFPGAPGTYNITFTNSGAYVYLCLIHSNMKGTIVVLPKGTAIPSKEEQSATAHQEEAVLQVEASAEPHDAVYTANKDGSLTYNVELGTPSASMNVMRMVPDVVVVSEGDSVTWTNVNPYEPHMVTFNKPDNVDVVGDQGVNPAYMGPVGSAIFDGKGIRHSGMMMQNQTYTLKFTKTGTYVYECYMHSFMMMKGTVIVVPKASVKLTVNGKAIIGTAAKAQWINGNLLVAADSFAKAFGGKAVWDKKARLWVVTANGKTIKAAAYVLKGTPYVSAEAVVRAIGGSYAWNETTRTFTATAHKVTATPKGSDMPGMSHS
ncbi:plastocyanin/azurin family copper-binding protein [Paenibacillus sp. OV219]|uniref:plastocyanin/azurin family copper-binding protein n=1 Tax=Paenibacillus sp. OV219 TaxID=1884377 RepID=UPI0008B07376|nr:plastocyanin/azurin family copper-binding protein [Paenibacillus sp. OV219]SEN55817.1 Plastocyanin [Paenibacillus sp. OV219]